MKYIIMASLILTGYTFIAMAAFQISTTLGLFTIGVFCHWQAYAISKEG